MYSTARVTWWPVGTPCRPWSTWGAAIFTAAVVYGNAQARGALEPGTKAGSNVLNLEAGEVRLELVARDGTRDQPADVSWTVYRYRPGDQRGPEVVVTDAARPELTLDAGWYEVRARLAGKSDPSSIREHVVEVKAGREQAYRIFID